MVLYPTTKSSSTVMSTQFQIDSLQKAMELNSTCNIEVFEKIQALQKSILKEMPSHSLIPKYAIPSDMLGVAASSMLNLATIKLAFDCTTTNAIACGKAFVFSFGSGIISNVNLITQGNLTTNLTKLKTIALDAFQSVITFATLGKIKL